MKQGLSIVLGLILFTFSCEGQSNSNNKNAKNSNTKEVIMDNGMNEEAIFGAGCFWCVEAIFQRVPGVIKIESGYSGGTKENPTYKEVCTGLTGHAEVIKLVYDPKVVSFETLLSVFWQTHDPTTLNRQGGDIGTQYRSVIFYKTPSQKESAEKLRAELDKSGAFQNPIVTEISPLSNYYPAEDYHQNYYSQNSEQSYCQFVIAPKLEKFEKVFGEQFRKK